MLFTGKEHFELPHSIKEVLIVFLKLIKKDLPTPDVYKAIGMKGATSEQALAAIQSIFNVTEEELA